MATIVTSRTANFDGAVNVSGYSGWSPFMNSNAISFTTSTQNLATRTDTRSVTVNIPNPGTYIVTCAADNAPASSITVGGNSCAVGGLDTAGLQTSVILAAGSQTITITIGNVDTGAPITEFADNPMGMAFTIDESRIQLPDRNVAIPAGPQPDPGPWTPSIPTCGSAPTLSSTSGGLQISRSDSNSVALNLRNYADKLVTLQVVHQNSANWQNGFNFNIPNASDIVAGGAPLGGQEYNRSGYSNSNIGPTTTFYLYNLDGGDYDYIFSHSSVPGSVPTRTNYEEVCTTTTETVVEQTDDSVFTETQVTTTTCVWQAITETYSGAWPPCSVDVAIAQNGGNEVRWCYSDGGGDFCRQTVTITVENVRDTISQSTGICMSDIKDRVWIADPGDGTANGNCLSEYRDHSTALSQNRYRNPSARSSKTTFPDPLCFTEFRGIAGAKTPGDMGIP